MGSVACHILSLFTLVSPCIYYCVLKNQNCAQLQYAIIQVQFTHGREFRIVHEGYHSKPLACLRCAHHQAFLVKSDDVQHPRLCIPQTRRRRRKRAAIALVEGARFVPRYP